MEATEYRVSLSVGTKLTASVLVLLSGAIAYLDISSILLFRDDKRAYTFQSQSVEAESAGREFVNIAKQALALENLLLAAIEPDKPITKIQQINLQSILNNQTTVAAATLGLLDKQKIEITTTFQANKAGLTDEELKVPHEFLLESLPIILREGYALFNLTKLGQDPLLVIAFADLKYKSVADLVPIALAYVVLKDFGKEIKTSILTLSTRSGHILFSTDPTLIFAQSKITDDPIFGDATNSALASGVQEFEHLGTRYLSSFYKPGLDLVVLTKTPWYKAMAATYALIEDFILLGLMTIGAAIIFGVLFAKSISKPIAQLYQATKEVASGNFILKLKESTHDEIGALTRSFSMMSKKIMELIVESMQRVQLENEVAIASTVQHALLPPEKYEDEKVDIYSHYKSASQCGGDWWGFFRIQNKMVMMIADATGHGLPSALMTASARSCLSMFHKECVERNELIYSPQKILSYLNHAIFDAASGHIMMTFFVSVLNFDTKKMIFANAGHNPPWYLKKEAENFFVHSLSSGGLRLGESRDYTPPSETEMDISKDDLFFLYTDGLIEGRNPEGENYGKKRARKIILETAAFGPEMIVKGIMEDFKTFSKNQTPDDDITLVTTKFKIT